MQVQDSQVLCACGCGTLIDQIDSKGRIRTYVNHHARRSYTSRALADRLWSRTDRSGDCWLWLGALSPKGYGSIMTGSKCDGTHKAKRAQRVAWEITYGPIPDGLFVCHHCDVPRCVRPEHLFLGTAAENTADMLAKGRESHDHGSKGVANCNAVLNDDKVRAILGLHARGVRGVDLAQMFGVNKVTISKVTRGETWRHVQ